MKRETNKDRIITASLDLFNQSGTVSVTTNHIAAHLLISPGNLYFHYRDRQDIVRKLFERMCEETYQIWYGEDGNLVLRRPEELVEKVFEVFYKYRFFHREMYHLRRQDPQLSATWKKHIKKTERLFLATYSQWVRQGWMKPVADKAELQFISDTILITSSSFLNFYESAAKPARNRSIKVGADYVLRLLEPYKVKLN
jgi:AcrR family transcriptional regulator